MSGPTVMSHAFAPGHVWTPVGPTEAIDGHEFQVSIRDDGWTLRPLGWYRCDLVSPDGAMTIAVWRTQRGWFSSLFSDTGLRQGFTTADRVADYTIEDLTCGR
jgi:hypothetical protein